MFSGIINIPIGKKFILKDRTLKINRIHTWHWMQIAFSLGSAFTIDAAKMILSKLGYSEIYGNLITLPICCEVAVRKKRKHLDDVCT